MSVEFRRPPALLVRIASALLPREDRELLLGDLEDAYAARAARGHRSAAVTFVFEAIHASVARRTRDDSVLESPKGRPMFEALGRDIRYGLRGLARNPGFTA